MIVDEIMPEVEEVLGISDQSRVFRYLSNAIELLSNKGQWDSLTCCLDIPAQSSNLIALPPQVKSVMRVNINKNPTFTRSRLWEFTLNTAGSNDVQLGYELLEQGRTPIQFTGTIGGKIKVTGDAADNAVVLRVTGIISGTVNEATENLTVNGAKSANSYDKIINVVKPVTTHPVTLSKTENITTPNISITGTLSPDATGTYTPDGYMNAQQKYTNGTYSIYFDGSLNANGGWYITQAIPADGDYWYSPDENLLGDYTASGATTGTPTVAPIIVEQLTSLSVYSPSERNPAYRLMKVSQINVPIRVMFRRAGIAITSVNDWIPLDSQMAVVMMVKAVKQYRDDHFEPAAASEATALKFLTESQKALTDSIEITTQGEIQTATNTPIRDSSMVIVADIYDDCCTVLGPVGRQKVFDAITNAREVLNNKKLWDSSIGYIDLQTNDAGSFTLPRYVDTPIEINVNGAPGLARTKWFEFNMSGPGSIDSNKSRCTHGWDDMGDVVIVNELPVSGAYLVARGDSAQDDGATITVYGLDADGKPVTAFVHSSSTNPQRDTNAPKIVNIQRIVKPQTSGFVKLLTLDDNNAEDILLGYYYPDETEPRYRRIKISHRATAIRMRYRVTKIKVTSMFDPLNISSRLAMIYMVRALKAAEKDIKAAEQFEQKAVTYLIEDQNIRNPNAIPQLRVSHGLGAHEYVTGA